MTTSAAVTTAPAPLPMVKRPPPLPPAARRYFAVARALGVLRSTEAPWSMQDLFSGVELRDRRVVDVGGGNGFVAFYAAAMGAREALVLDPALARAGAARATFERLRAELPGLPVTADPRRLEEAGPGGRHDALVLHDAIGELDVPACRSLLHDPGARETYRALFARLRALARDGATLVVYDRTPANLYPLVRAPHPL
ncbi:MAG TPA: hypothetical protein VD838_20180, partial [Anaeromyxobacteraceae bacterium]|nr:hypothetical protein [Anaeromyxobacteraceae bacterium]